MRAIDVLTFLATVVYVRCDASSDGYIMNKAEVNDAYRLVYQAQPWAAAEAQCEKEGGTLAVPKSLEEFKFLQKLVRGMSYSNIHGSNYKLLVWIGINNLKNYTIWRNVDGENINDTGFSTFAEPYTPFSDPKEPHCVGMDAINLGFRVYWCHEYQPFICKKKANLNPNFTV